MWAENITYKCFRIGHYRAATSREREREIKRKREEMNKNSRFVCVCVYIWYVSPLFVLCPSTYLPFSHPSHSLALSITTPSSFSFALSLSSLIPLITEYELLLLFRHSWRTTPFLSSFLGVFVRWFHTWLIRQWAIMIYQLFSMDLEVRTNQPLFMIRSYLP